MGWKLVAVAGTALLMGVRVSAAQVPATPDAATQQAPAAAATADGGTIHGTVKAGPIPLPGVAITATSTVTGKKFATTTDVDGNYSMTVPKDGPYVVKAELAAFATVTHEVSLTAAAADQTMAFALELASRAAPPPAAAPARGTRPAGGGAPAVAGTAAGGGRPARTYGQGRGTVALNVEGNTEAGLAATTGGSAADANVPSLGFGGDAGDSVTVSGAQGQTNAIAGLSEDQLNQRINDISNNVRQQGGNQNDQLNTVVSLLGPMMGMGGPGGPGGPGGGPGGGGGGRGGGGGGRGGGGGGFRNFNPAQPHGSIFYQGGNNALNSAPWQPSLVAQVNPAAYQNRFGLSIAGTPYIPGLTKPDTRQFVFINLTGQKNLNAFAPASVRVPTALERTGDFSQSSQVVNGVTQKVQLYDPVTGAAILTNNLAQASVPISTQALNLLKSYYPLPNINVGSTDPTVLNYQTISNAGSNNVAINSRYQRQLGQQTGQGFGGRGGGGGGRGQRGNQNAPPVLRQNINASYNYSHSASDNRNIFLPLGGRSESDGNALNLGYVVSYGRISNNASLNWNRLSSETSNYFTDTTNNPTGTLGISIPNQASNFADPRFYNGLPSIQISPFQGLSTTTPSETINQTIAFSDFVAWRHKRHNFRFGGDIRRVHDDVIGGNNPLGSFSFTGYATANPADQVINKGGTNSGYSFADFLLGLPQTTTIQAGIYKDYLRENVYDWYATDDFRIKTNVTLNYGIRYEYFGPYTEKNDHLVNLDHTAFSPNGNNLAAPVTPGHNGQYSGSSYPRSLVNPDYLMYAPRLGFAYSPRFKWSKNVVVRGGYGVNYNTGQYATFAQKLSRQEPFATTQTNSPAVATVTNPTPTATGCVTTQSSYTFTPTATTSNPAPQPVVRPATNAAAPQAGSQGMTLANGFTCSTGDTISSDNWAVDRNYRLGNVQIFNLAIQKTFGPAIVATVGYNGSKASNLDVVGSPNATPAVSSNIANVAPFDYEESVAGAHSNSLVVSVQQRQRKGIALGATYTYLHSIDNASGVGGAVGTPVQNFYRLDLEEGNSSFDQRHNLTGTWLMELPFGPNREFLNKGGAVAKLLDGFNFSGSFTFATGNYYTPTYSGNQAEATGGNTFNQRPNRDYTQSTVGPGKVKSFFNTAAFSAPASGQYGTASQGSIEGPGTTAVSAALSRTVTLRGTNSFEARVQATNVFNTVQYASINTNDNSNQFGQVTSAAAMRSLVFIARYRF
jgi:hypothetical protein